MDQDDQQVTTMWAYLIEDGGVEGVPAVLIEGQALPLMGANMETALRLQPIAQEVVNRTGHPVTLAKFTTREDVVILFPSQEETMTATADSL